mmetsp:Transcript_7154/g.15640  ORF Transcript_7154/g.15640 Transcript_7154/m.15640 type:complete len:90 (+) Transcript_7154:321-590(+)
MLSLVLASSTIETKSSLSVLHHADLRANKGELTTVCLKHNTTQSYGHHISICVSDTQCGRVARMCMLHAAPALKSTLHELLPTNSATSA